MKPFKIKFSTALGHRSKSPRIPNRDLQPLRHGHCGRQPAAGRHGQRLISSGSLAGAVDGARLSGALDSPLGKPVSSDMGWDRVLFRDPYDARYRIVNSGRLMKRARSVVSTQFLRDIDEASRIYHIVGRVQNTSLLQFIAVSIQLQLVIGRAGYDAAFEPANGSVVEDSAQRAGRENITFG